jgi:hypothetical protein
MTRSKTVGEAVAVLLREGSGVRVRVPGEAGGAVEVPIPPSANHLFPTNKSGRRFPSKNYEAWKKVAGPLVRVMEPPTVFPVAIRYTLTGAINPLRDLGNIEKPLTDLLVSEGRIPDDRLKFVGRIVLDHEPGPGEARVRIAFEPLTGEVVT